MSLCLLLLLLAGCCLLIAGWLPVDRCYLFVLVVGCKCSWYCFVVVGACPCRGFSCCFGWCCFVEVANPPTSQTTNQLPKQPSNYPTNPTNQLNQPTNLFRCCCRVSSRMVVLLLDYCFHRRSRPWNIVISYGNNKLLLLLLCVVSVKFHDFDQLYQITSRAYPWIISHIDMHIQQYIAYDGPYLTLRYCEIVHLHQFRIDNRWLQRMMTVDDGTAPINVTKTHLDTEDSVNVCLV